MITLTDLALSVLTRSYRIHLRVESWLGEELLAETVPVAVASEEGDRSSNVPERVTLTVPRRDRGMSWSPVEVDHPLAANGQRLRVQLGIGVAGEPEWFQRGWFVIHESKSDIDTVTVNAVGLLHLVHEARLVSPFQPTGTLVSSLRGLVEPALTVEFDAALTDRAVPSGVNYDEDRLGAVNELLDAWPAEAYVTEEGYLAVVPPATTASDPVLTLTNGAGGTVIEATGSSSREDSYNAVVARGTASDGAQVQGVAFDFAGAKRYGGPFNPLAVPYFFSSPLLTTVAQAQAAANTVLARIKRQTALRFTAAIVPHPALQVGDVVSITTDDHSDLLCTIEALRLPWTPDGNEPQHLTLRSLT
jgi:hypothetical protein